MLPHQNNPMPEDMHKTYTTEEGLDQEIQRAIAQHDLEQQQNQETPHDPALLEADTSKAMDAETEKQQLAMIADELKKATTSVKEEAQEPSQMDPNEQNQQHQPDQQQQNQGNQQQEQQQNQQQVDQQIEHPMEPHIGTMEHPQMDQMDLQIDGQLQGPQLSDRSPRPDAKSLHIPADSELLATNNALAAYNALSSHVPPVASMASVHLAALPMPIVAPDYLPARIQLLISSLPVLDNLASQLLRVFAVGPYQKIIDLASSPDTPPGAAFRDLTSLFEFTKRLYSEEDPFLTVEHLAPGMWKEGEKTPSMFLSREQTIESTLRKVNLATFLAATLGTIEVGFFHLNESFLNVFCPANYLDPMNSMSNMSAANMNLQSNVNTVIGDKVGKILKPQAGLYLDLKTQAYISAIEAGERSSEEILEDILPSGLEEILLERRGVKTLSPTEHDFINRCKARKDTLLNYPQGANLSEEYEWFAFLRDMFDFVSKNMSFLIWGKKGKVGVSRADRHVATPHSDEVMSRPSMPAAPRPEENEASNENHPEINDITAALLPSEIQEQQIHLRINTRVGSKVGNRRPWTREEEKALRHALELKGPHWSTILELFGQGGQINESLKNRTQVQLKDKARNWKMFFLKAGLPVPGYLQKVTGDLERDDKMRAKNARNRKTAAAPVPLVVKRDGTLVEQGEGDSEPSSKKRKS